MAVNARIVTQTQYTQTTYPEILLPNSIREILQRTPKQPEPPKEPYKPYKPSPSGKSYTNDTMKGNRIVYYVGIVIFIVLAITDSVPIGASLLIIVCLALLILTSLDGKKNQPIDYDTALQVYEKELVEYNQKYEVYLHQKEDYDRQVNQLHSPENLSAYRKKDLDRWIEYYGRPEFEPNPNPTLVVKGASEDFFWGELKKRNYQVIQNVRVPSFYDYVHNSQSYYYPDIVLESKGIYYDIEIDEPYEGTLKKPIHYIDQYGKSIDDERNKFMTGKRWVVIRLAEEQVFKQTKACLDYIDSVIQSLSTGIMPSMETEFSIKKWTEQEAITKADNSYRETYIPSHTPSPIPKLTALPATPLTPMEFVAKYGKKNHQLGTIKQTGRFVIRAQNEDGELTFAYANDYLQSLFEQARSQGIRFSLPKETMIIPKRLSDNRIKWIMHLEEKEEENKEEKEEIWR